MKGWWIALTVAAACGGGGGDDVVCRAWPDDATYACICRDEGGGLGGDEEDMAEPAQATCGATEFVPDTLCCATPGYPSEDESSCYCTALRCGADQFGDCVCTWNPYSEVAPGATSCFAPEGGTCCMDENIGFCRCSSLTDCGTGRISVGTCDSFALGECQDGDVPVADCNVVEDDGGDGDDGIPL